MADRWSKEEERNLLMGVGVYGAKWFKANTVGRTLQAIWCKAVRLYGGRLTRGSYTLKQICEITGYDKTQVKRAGKALAQKWKRLSARGSFLIYEEQMEEIVQWLAKDYWSKKHRLYACLWCGTEENEHMAQGLCKRCYQVYTQRLHRAGWPYQVEPLLLFVSASKLLDRDEMIIRLKAGRALSRKHVQDLVDLMHKEVCNDGS